MNIERLRYIINTLASNISTDDKLNLQYEGNKLLDELADSATKKSRKS